MAQGIQAWSLTAGDNGTADANINYAEGQSPPSLNNSARAMMSALRAFYNSLGGGVTYGGAANAYTITQDAVGAWTAYAEGLFIGLEANHTNNGAATVNVDGLGAKSIVKSASTAVASGDIVSGAFYLLRYDGTNFQIVGSGGLVQPHDATLDALAAMSYTSGILDVTLTAADTITLTQRGTSSQVFLGPAGAVGAPTYSFSGDPNTGFYNLTTDSIGLALGGSLSWFWQNGNYVSGGGVMFTGDGSAAATGYGFLNDADCGLYRIGANNIGIAANGALVADWNASRLLMAAGFDLQRSTTVTGNVAASVGYIGTVIDAMSGDRTVANVDDGKTLYHTSASTHTLTIDSNANLALPVGFMVAIENESGGGAVSIAITSDTLRWGSSTGTRSLAANGSAVLKKVATTTWRLTGTNIT